jgi:hypothetical protein
MHIPHFSAPVLVHAAAANAMPLNANATREDRSMVKTPLIRMGAVRILVIIPMHGLPMKNPRHC